MAILHRCAAGARKLFWPVAAATLTLDLLSKWLLWHAPASAEQPIVLVPHVLQIVPHAGNTGGAFGLPGTPALYAAAAVLGLALIIGLLLTTSPRRLLVHLALGLIAGGALGNLADRIALGFVRDFLDLHWGSRFHWPTFNLADAAITAGFILVVWDAYVSGRGEEQPSGQAAAGAADP